LLLSVSDLPIAGGVKIFNPAEDETKGRKGGLK
jgi:hypothetical protein